MPIGTARMAHLALAGSRLLDGIAFDDDPRLTDLFAADAVAPGSVAVLFPGPEARTLDAWPTAPPTKLVVLDGTWHQAGKLLRENPRLAALPRLAFMPAAPGRYRIRKEPRDECLSTIEAIGAVLTVLEHDAALGEALLRPFDAMVEAQLEHAARARHPEQRHDDNDTAGAVGSSDERGRGRHRSRSQRRGVDRRFRELLPLLRRPERVVVVYAEANAAPREARGVGAPGLLHLVAARPFVDDNDGFDVVVRPEAAVHPDTLHRLGLQAADVEAGVSPATAVALFRGWCGDGRLLSWGSFPRDLLVREGDACRGFVDLRALACRALDGPAGGLEAAATRFDVVVPPLPTRAGRMLAAAVGVARRIAGRALDDRPVEHADDASNAASDDVTTSGILPP